MTATTAIGYGIRRAFGQPRLIAAELAWRWSWGAALGALIAIGVTEVMRNTIVIGSHPFSGLPARLALVTASLLGGATFLWILAAAGGGCATLPLLFREKPAHPRFRSLAGNAFLRAALWLAAALALLMAWRLAGNVTRVAERHVPGWWLLAFVPAAALIIFLWMTIRWLLALSPLFSATADRDAVSALGGAMELLCARPGAMLLIATVFGVLQMWLCGATGLFALSMITGMARVSAAAAWIASALVALGYFAIAGALRLARLGAYAAMVEDSAFTAS
jgi:hypothetical protein